MFWLGMLLGLFFGANVTIILYSCIIVGKRFENEE